MKLHYDYEVKDKGRVRDDIRTMEDRLHSSGGEPHTVTLKNQAGTKQVDIKLELESGVVKYTLLDKVVYTREEVYKLVNAELGFP